MHELGDGAAYRGGKISGPPWFGHRVVLCVLSFWQFVSLSAGVVASQTSCQALYLVMQRLNPQVSVTRTCVLPVRVGLHGAGAGRGLSLSSRRPVQLWQFLQFTAQYAGRTDTVDNAERPDGHRLRSGKADMEQ
jgi:hypothetical protein